MENQIITPDPVKNFAERLKDRVKESACDLLTDEELKLMLEKSVQDVFFERKLIKKGQWNSPDEYSEPLFYGIVKDVMKDRVATVFEEWLKSNPEKVENALKETIEAQASTLMLKAINNIFCGDLQNFQIQLSQKVYQLENKV